MKNSRNEIIDKFYCLPIAIRRIIIADFFYEKHIFSENDDYKKSLKESDYIKLTAFSGGFSPRLLKEDFKFPRKFEKMFFDFLKEKDIFNQEI